MEKQIPALTEDNFKLCMGALGYALVSMDKLRQPELANEDRIKTADSIHLTLATCINALGLNVMEVKLKVLGSLSQDGELGGGGVR